MRRFFLIVLLCLCAAGAGLQASPKREMRAAWVATVWALDWPSTPAGTWVTDPVQQKELLVQLLDSMQRMNMNCVALQGRTMSDAWYKSKYEPWSQWITGTRGAEPTYDPMAFAVEEAHKRGMELHVWINPYRHSSSTTQYDINQALADDYANTHPEWLMSYNGATILNPGLPEVKTRICAIVADLIEHYDVDGILFDDYFYLSGTPNSMDADLYKANNQDNLSQADWRREQVNEMVRRVQDTIRVTKPWVTFGIGPAPQVASSKAHADKYGVPVGPFADWQYNGIYSDPLAWMSRRTIDYIAPQMYWHVGSSTCDFTQLSAWWSLIAEKYGRHFYASHSVADSDAGETGKEVEVLRADGRIDAPGSVLYSIRSGVYKSSSYTRRMRESVWQYPALPPQKWWRRQAAQLFVSDIRYTTGKISWTAPAGNSNVRYAVYMIPSDSIGRQGQFFSSRYLLGMSYETSYQVPLRSGYTYAVSVVDRYGNEYAPRVFNRPMVELKAPVSVYPADGAAPLLPTWFTWQAVEGADSYFIEIARDKDMQDLIAYVERGEPRFYTGDITLLEEGRQYWWRVTARGANAEDVTGETRVFTGSPFAMVSPVDGEKNVSLTPEFVCDSVAAETAEYTFEVSSSKTFVKSGEVWRATVLVPRVQMPDSLLAPSTTYYVRASVRSGDIYSITSARSFRTEALPVPEPVILSPQDGDTIRSTEVTAVWKAQNAGGFRMELSTTESFAPRMTKTISAGAFATQATLTGIAPGEYYLRVRATGEEGYVYSEAVQIVVEAPTALETTEDRRPQVRKLLRNGQILILMPDGRLYNPLGIVVE